MGRFWRGIITHAAGIASLTDPDPISAFRTAKPATSSAAFTLANPKMLSTSPPRNDADQVAIADSVLPHDELIDLTSWLGSLGRWRRVVTRVSRPRLRVLRNPLARVMFRNKALDYFGFAIGP